MAQIEFGPFVFDSDSAALRRDGNPLPLGGRAGAVLGALIAGDGNVVGKAELMAAAWPGVVVEEGNLSVQITALRKVLGARPDGTEWIATVPRVGYRLVRSGSPLEASRHSLPCIAVLPFTNLSSDPEQEFFADGVAEDIITALSRFHSIAVVARNSSFTFKGRNVDVREAATQLGAGYILEGSVRKAGTRLRTTAQLIDGSTGAHLWAHNFDGDAGEIFDVQDRITQSVASVVAPRIETAESDRARRERPNSTAGHDLYLRALPRIDTDSRPETNREGLELLDQALAIDPDYVPALALAAHALEHGLTMGWPAYGPDDAERAVAYARRALMGARNDAVILCRCAMVLLMVAHDFAMAVTTCEKAVQANPHNASVIDFAAIAHLVGGDMDRAEELFQRAVDLSLGETVHSARTGLAAIALTRGNYEQACEFALRSLTVAPNYNPTYWYLIAAYGYLGRLDEAAKTIQALEAMVPDISISSIGRAVTTGIRIESLLNGLRLAGMREN